MAISRNWSNLRDFLRKTYNKEVNAWFADVDDPTPDNSTSRKQAKRACLLLPKETQNMALLKMLTFRYECQQVHLRPEIYGIPTLDFHESVIYKPQIVIHWTERTDIATANNRKPIKAQCSVRYRGTYESKNDLLALKRKIISIFTAGSAEHHWTKGRIKYSYRDKIKGYEMIITASNVSDAKEVIGKMLAIQNDTINEDFLTTSTTDRSFTARETVTVAGRIFEKPKRRPTGVVYFNRAEFKIHGMPKDIILVSRGGLGTTEFE
jgi:hypothetical protein